MLLTDLNGPVSLQPRRPGFGRVLLSHCLPRPSRSIGPAILFLTCAMFGASISRAQDQQDQSVAEAARQEQARKQELQKRAKHVYTEEDLKHPNILTPEDRTQVEAKRNECAQKNNCAPAPTQKPAESLDANSQQPSLGEVARELRKQKELQALKPKQQEPFHLPSAPALASPILPERSAVRPPAQPVLRAPAQPVLRPKTPSNVFRRDPFSAFPVPEVRRPEITKREVTKSEVARPEVAKPEVRRPEIRPSFREDVVPDGRPSAPENIQPMVRPNFSKEVRPKLRATEKMIAPAAPKIPVRAATPGILIQPAQPSAPVKPAQPVVPVAPASKIRSVQPPTLANPVPATVLAEPIQPPALAQPVQPVAPVETVRPMQPKLPVPPPAAVTQNVATVRSGDSLWKLAQHALGRGSRWPEILALNPAIVDPDQIHVGARINLPAVASLNRARDDRKSSNIRVRRGDTLWSLAKSSLGRSADWPCLASANPGVADPNRIYEGQELALPKSCNAPVDDSSSHARP